MRQVDALAHDWQINPPNDYYTHNGKPVFFRTPGYMLLRQDIADKKHIGVAPSELCATRPEYQILDVREFKDRIGQAIRRERLINWMNAERQQEVDKRAKRRAELGLPPVEEEEE